MKAKWKYILIAAAVLCVLAIVLAVTFTYAVRDFMSEGVHVIGRYAHVDIQEKCYFINGQTKAVVGESTLTISGYLFDEHYDPFSQSHDASRFDGFMDIDGKSTSVKEGYGSYMGSISNGEARMLTVLYAPFEGDSTNYYAHISLSDPEVIVVHYLFEDEQIVAVCGDSEEDALENYEKYWDILQE